MHYIFNIVENKIDFTQFDRNLLNSPPVLNPCTDVDDYAQQIEETVMQQLDKVAPLKNCRRRQRAAPADSFLSQEATAAKRNRRRLERLWLRTGDTTIRQQYRAACRQSNKLISDSRSRFLSNSINSVCDIRAKWRAMLKVLHNSKAAHFTEGSKGTTPSAFVSAYSTFLVNKISTLRSKCTALLLNSISFGSAYTTSTTSNSDPLSHGMQHSGCITFQFEPVTPLEVRRMLDSVTIKPSSSDLFPSSIIKSCPHFFSIVISHLANLSFTSGNFPLMYKSANITPVLKKPGLPTSDPASYRPISNLNSISKILERLVLVQLSPLIVSSPNFDSLQSAYRKSYSTETALLKSLSDIYSFIDTGSSVLAVSLDLSAAFDTDPHSTLILRLEHTFGISGLALSWLTSYLSNRSQTVCAGGASSSLTSLQCGVPQGSVLGPLLFTAFISPMAHLLSSFGLSHQQYADDSLIYLDLPLNNFTPAVHKIESGLFSLCMWLAKNGLAVNPSKSDAILFSTRQRLAKLASAGLSTVTVCDSTIAISDSITLLGIILDSTLSFDKHCRSVFRTSLYHLRSIKHIRHLLSPDDAKTLSACFVQSRLDFSNSILYNTSAFNLNRLQRVQNSLARLTVLPPPGGSSTDLLSQLHWLPIKERINFKIASLSHSTLITGQPSYLHQFLVPYTPTRTLRSAGSHQLTKQRCKLSMTSQSFAQAAPSVWNSLPLTIRQSSSEPVFRKQLKTHLFSVSITV